MRPLERALCIAMAAGALGACSTTEIVVVVDSDLPSRDVGGWYLRVEGDTSARCFTVAGADAALPLTLGVAPAGPGQQIRVTAAALAGPVETASSCADGVPPGILVEQRAQAAFVDGARRVLLMTLESACLGQTCASDETCRGGRCGPPATETTPWTGEVPRLGDGGAPAFDGGLDAGVDGGLPDGGTDAGPFDGGPFVPPDGGPCSGGTLRTATTAPPLADTVLPVRDPCEPGFCGGTDVIGDEPVLNVGVGRVLLRFSLPGSVPADLATIDGTVNVVLPRAPDFLCSGCRAAGDVEARALRTDWSEREAFWCRRSGEGNEGPCDRWGADGAAAEGIDLFGPGARVATTGEEGVVRIPLPLESFRSASGGSGEVTALAVRLRWAPSRGGPPEGSQAVLVLCSRESELAGDCRAPYLEIEWCER